MVQWSEYQSYALHKLPVKEKRPIVVQGVKDVRPEARCAVAHILNRQAHVPSIWYARQLTTSNYLSLSP